MRVARGGALVPGALGATVGVVVLQENPRDVVGLGVSVTSGRGCVFGGLIAGEAAVGAGARLSVEGGGATGGGADLAKSVRPSSGSASVMNAFQVGAAKVPPYTRAWPLMLVSGRRESEKPIQMAVDNWGV